MNREKYYNELIIDKSLADKLNFNPYYPILHSGLSDPLIVNGQEFINLASNNYLGIACDKRIKKAMIKGVERYGASMCGTPIATGYVDIFKKVEERLSKFVGLDDSTIFPSCYQANMGIFSVLLKKEDAIIVDHYAHNSLVSGILSVGCKIAPFLHNNMSHLKKLLEGRSNYRQVFIVTESVFSTEGSIAPFDEIVSLCDEYDAIPVIDDSHGIGVIGNQGRGILDEKNIENFQGIYTASLGKALAGIGGMVGGKKSLVDYLRYACSSLIYSTALPPSNLLGLDKTIDIIEEEFSVISKRMWRYKNLISTCLKDLQFRLAEGEAPITSVMCGSLEDTIRFSMKLYEHTILSTPFVPPSVPQNRGCVRLIAGANLKEQSIQSALKAFEKISKEVV
ncbi:MAG: aminotransferase [Spirochaetes bacterium DG_61]|nr:MAG: aminotransferase [Spirochaetes bacterium DG_61]